MKILATLVITVFSITLVSAQEPFDVPTVDYSKLKIIDYTKSFGFSKAVESYTINSNNVEVFANQNFSLLINSDNQKNVKNSFPAINVSVIKYRLGLFSYTSKKKGKNVNIGDTVRVFMPLILMSKFTLDYDSLNYASLNDATSFSGSPFTFRIMPSHTFKVGLENTFTIGFVGDLRGIILSDSTSNNTDFEFGVYYSLGAKYSGKGDVRDETGQSYVGKWSLSGLLYGFTGSGTTDKELYGGLAERRGLEFVFKFKLLDTKLTRFNLLANAQYQFNSLTKESPWIFKFGIGN